MKENPIQKRVWVRASEFGCRLFRINVGTGWTSNRITQIPRAGNYILQKGDVVCHQAWPFSTGAPKGYPDLSGYTPVVITPEMVGKTMAIYTSFEIKTAKGVVKKEQKNFYTQARDAGAIAGVLRSEEDVNFLFTEEYPFVKRRG